MSKSTKDITNHPIVIFVISIISILMGVVFIYSQSDNKPIPREQAVSYTGTFDRYDTLKNYCIIHFEDGSTYDVYPHTETVELREKIQSLAKGTPIYLLVNPNNEYVVEIKTDTEELLNFEQSQKEIDSYDNWYIGIGIFACISGVFLIVYAVGLKKNSKKEKDRQTKPMAMTAIRHADNTAKSKVFLEATVKGYEICYRRIKLVNELVVNGLVYDEIKGIIEYEHRLRAVVDNHVIEAGLDEESYSYIIFDKKLIKRKKRII